MRSAPWALVGMVLLGPLVLGAGIRADDLACEHAAVVLDECCPDLSAIDLDCSYDSGGCLGTPEPPLLDEAESNCIRKESCKELADSGVCERVRDRSEARAQAAAADEDFDWNEEEPAVCP